MNPKIILSSFPAFLLSLLISCQAPGNPARNQEVPQERLAEFARCMTERGWIMYSSFTCPACRAQQKLFGDASVHLNIIECNPQAPDTQVEQCLKKNIRYTPTWLMEKNGTEVKRLKGYQELEELASMTGCAL